MFVCNRESTEHSGLGFTYSIPSDWSFVRFSFFIGFQEGPGIMAADFRDEGTPLLRIRNVQSEVVDLNGCNFLDPIDVEQRWSKYRVQEDDLLISCSASTGLVTKVDDRAEGAIAYTGLIRLWPQRSEITRDFIRWLVQSEIFFNQVDVLKTGSTMQHFGPEHLGRMFITLPPLPEQERIASFLDWKTGEIDRLIAKKRALISALAEKRMAVITQAVTRGLNPDAPLKETGIPWLREVPEHWEVMKFGYQTEVKEGQVDPEVDPYIDYPLIAPNHIESNTGRITHLESARDQGAISGKYEVSDGDVVYSKIRPHLNKCCLATFDGLCSADMYPIKPSERMDAGFLVYWILAQPFFDYAELNSMRVAMPKLNRETLSAAPLVVPEIPEQITIREFLDCETSRIDRLTEKASSVIDRLTEYRTALITAATTGKIDVRNVDIPAA